MPGPPVCACCGEDLHTVPNDVRKECEWCNAPYCSSNCVEKHRYGAHAPCALKLAQTSHELCSQLYRRHVLLMMLESPDNVLKGETAEVIAEFIGRPQRQLTDYANFPRLHHWLQGGLTSSIIQYVQNVRQELAHGPTGGKLTTCSAAQPAGLSLDEAGRGLCAALQILCLLLEEPPKDWNEECAAHACPHLVPLSPKDRQAVAITLLMASKGAGITAASDLALNHRAGGAKSVHVLGRLLGDMERLLNQSSKPSAGDAEEPQLPGREEVSGAAAAGKLMEAVHKGVKAEGLEYLKSSLSSGRGAAASPAGPAADEAAADWQSALQHYVAWADAAAKAAA